MRTIHFEERREYDRLLSAGGRVSVFPHVFNGTFENHHHAYVEMMIVRKGSAIHRVNGQEALLKPGDVFVLGEGVSHSVSEAKHLDLHNIGFRSNFDSWLGDDVKKMPGYQALFVTSRTGFRAFVHLSPPELAAAEEVVSRMLGEMSTATPGKESFVNLLAAELVILLSRLYSKKSSSFTETIYPLARAVGHMEANWNSLLTLESLAKLFGSSVRHFDHVFKNHYHVSPFAYLLRLRIKRAEELLIYSSRSITQVAHDCGFSDSNYFTRQFKRLTGRRPKDVRKKPGDA